MSAVTMIGLAIVALSYRQQELDSAGLSGNDQEAYNLTLEVTTEVSTIMANAVPKLFIAAIVVLVIVMLLLNR